MDNMNSSSVPGSGPRRMERVEICIISLSLLPPSRPWMTIGFLRLAKVEKDGVLLPCNGRRCPMGTLCRRISKAILSNSSGSQRPIVVSVQAMDMELCARSRHYSQRELMVRVDQGGGGRRNN